MTQRDVAGAMDWSPSKLIRIETGTVNISTNDLRALLNHYEVEQSRIDTLIDVARAAREQPRWNLYKDMVSPEFITFLGYESSASVIRNFEPLLVPGLLQTEEYATEVIGSGADPEAVESLVELRMQRQEMLTRQPPSVEFHFIMDEAVIRRIVGGRAVMRRQLRYLKEVAEWPNVAIRIIPFERGLYRGCLAPYVLLEFPDPEDEDVLYIEDSLGEAGADIIRENSPEKRGQLTPVKSLEIFWSKEQLARREDAPIMIEDALMKLTGDS